MSESIEGLPEKITLGSMKIPEYIDAFSDINELKKAAKLLLKQDGEWLDELNKEVDEKNLKIHNLLNDICLLEAFTGVHISDSGFSECQTLFDENDELKKKIVELEIRWNLRNFVGQPVSAATKEAIKKGLRAMLHGFSEEQLEEYINKHCFIGEEK